MTNPTAEYAAATDIGQVRRKNEDAFLVDTGLGLYAVADGMGGHQAGEVASRLALATLQEALAGRGGTPDERLRAAILAANQRVYDESIARGHVQGMGTTLTVLWLTGDGEALVGHVGDSRCYLLREGAFRRVTHDHSWVQMQVDDGVLTEAEAARHPMRNVVTRSIGFEPMIDVDVEPLSPQQGDLLLLASDGLTGKVSDDELAEALAGTASDSDLQAVVDTLIQQANDRGGDDNITVVLVRIAGYTGTDAG